MSTEDQPGPCTWVPEHTNELLCVDSATIAFVDRSHLASFLTELNRPPPQAASAGTHRFWLVDYGVVCDTGGDGGFGFTAWGAEDAVRSIEIECDEPNDPASWQHAAMLPAPSGVLLVGDPHYLDQYTVEDFGGPFFAAGLWHELRLPGAGYVAVDLEVPEGATSWAPAQTLRARWIAAPDRE